MARKKVVRTEEFLEDDPPSNREIPIDPRVLQDEDTLDYALKQFDDRNGLELKYYLTQPGGSAFIGGYPDIVPESQLQDWYPQGGKFEVRIYVHGEFRDRRFMIIAPRPGGMVSNGGGSGGSLEVQLLREQLQMLREEIRSRSQVPQQSSALELAQAVAAMQQLNGGSGNSGSIAEMFKTAMDMAKMIKGVPDEDNTFLGVVKDVVKEAGPTLLQGLFAAGKTPAMLPASSVAIPPTENPENQMDPALKQGLIFLKKKALAGADPGLYIDFAVDNRENELFQGVLHAILAPDSKFEVLSALDPEIGQPPYVEFFRAIYDGLRSAFSQTDTVVVSGVGKAGNVSDITDHAKPRKPGSK